jgi:hypothetical protein
VDRGNSVVSCEVGQLDTSAGKQRTTANEYRIGPFARDRCERSIDFAARASVEDFNFQRHGAGGCFHVAQVGCGNRDLGRIEQHGNTNGCGHQFAQECEPLCG